MLSFIRLLLLSLFFISCHFDQAINEYPGVGSATDASVSYPWMHEKIEEDLLILKDKMIHPHDVENYFYKHSHKVRNQLVYIKIENGQISWKTSVFEKEGAIERVRAIAYFFNKLKAKYRLPDCSFLISVDDAADYVGVDAQKPLPLFTFAKNKHSKHLTIPDFETLAKGGHDRFLRSDFSNLPTWEERKKQIFWRGTTTGCCYDHVMWMHAPRTQLVLLSQKIPNILDAAFGKFTQGAERPDVTAAMAAHNVFPHPQTSIKDHLKYRYLMDVDGNSCTYSRMAWLLLSKSLLFKHTSDNEQWYYRGLKPFVNYIPVKNDFSDLEEQYHYAVNHDEKAHEIALNAYSFGQEVFSQESIESYFVLLLQRYAQHMVKIKETN